MLIQHQQLVEMRGRESRGRKMEKMMEGTPRVQDGEASLIAGEFGKAYSWIRRNKLSTCFEGSNYRLWKSMTSDEFISFGIEEFIGEEEDGYTPMKKKLSKAEYKAMDFAIMELMRRSLMPDLLELVEDCNSALEVWETLKEMFEAENMPMESNLQPVGSSPKEDPNFDLEWIPMVSRGVYSHYLSDDEWEANVHGDGEKHLDKPTISIKEVEIEDFSTLESDEEHAFKDIMIDYECFLAQFQALSKSFQSFKDDHILKWESLLGNNKGVIDNEDTPFLGEDFEVCLEVVDNAVSNVHEEFDEDHVFKEERMKMAKLIEETVTMMKDGEKEKKKRMNKLENLEEDLHKLFQDFDPEVSLVLLQEPIISDSCCLEDLEEDVIKASLESCVLETKQREENFREEWCKNGSFTPFAKDNSDFGHFLLVFTKERCRLKFPCSVGHPRRVTYQQQVKGINFQPPFLHSYEKHKNDMEFLIHDDKWEDFTWTKIMEMCLDFLAHSTIQPSHRKAVFYGAELWLIFKMRPYVFCPTFQSEDRSPKVFYSLLNMDGEFSGAGMGTVDSGFHAGISTVVFCHAGFSTVQKSAGDSTIYLELQSSTRRGYCSSEFDARNIDALGSGILAGNSAMHAGHSTVSVGISTMLFDDHG